MVGGGWRGREGGLKIEGGLGRCRSLEVAGLRRVVGVLVIGAEGFEIWIGTYVP